jgi:hypothetical protein
VSLRAGDIDGIRRALERIRASPGGGRDFLFARVAGAVFDEIESLRSERHTLIDICRALEAEGYLPEGSNPRSLSKAMSRERKRRDSRRAGKPAREKRAEGVSSGDKLEGRTTVKRDGGAPEYQTDAASSSQLKPGNLFVIEPLDLEGMPEL